MKKLIIIFLFIIGAADLQAQQASSGEGANAGPSKKEEASAKVVNSNTSVMGFITFEVNDGMLVMDNIPNLNSMTVHITDQNGDEKIGRKLSARSNKIDISRLRKGAYFATITSENSDNRKSFSFSRD